MFTVLKSEGFLLTTLYVSGSEKVADISEK
jgi:hypothetical protein